MFQWLSQDELSETEQDHSHRIVLSVEYQPENALRANQSEQLLSFMAPILLDIPD